MSFGSYTHPSSDASSIIGPAGGSVQVLNPDSKIYGTKVVIPEGAVESPVAIRIIDPISLPNKPSIFKTADTAVELEPAGSRFYKPLQITIPYDESLINENDISVRVYDKEMSNWETVDIIQIDKINNLITVSLDHFSILQVFSDLFFDNPGKMIWDCISTSAETYKLIITTISNKGLNIYEAKDTSGKVYKVENDKVIINNSPYCIRKISPVNVDGFVKSRSLIID